MNVHIVLSYPDTKKHLYTWANEENSIDFRKEITLATRCTVAYAATELVSYLKTVNIFASFSSSEQKGAFNIFISADESSFENERFVLTPLSNGIKIFGDSRTGALYGVYEFLKLQGFVFLSPWQDYCPDADTFTLKNIDKETEFKADMPLGRGFVFEGPLKDSSKIWRWMAKNKLNLSTYRPFTGKTQRKLCMSFENGGHIFEAMLSPDNKTEDGIDFWDAHRDWYGDRENRESATSTQFCMSSSSLFDYLAQNLVDKINSDWYESDRIQLAVFDCWGKTCSCEKCSTLGNDTDIQLHFVSEIRKRIDAAFKNAQIDHNVRFSIAAYEGTASLAAPSRPVPDNIKRSGDYIIFYPILRCYKHAFGDETCSYNSIYNRHLKNWKGMIPIMIGEYYNVSKFEDAPMLFTRSMPDDLNYYNRCGASGMTYMHLPMLNWGVRTLTQLMYGELLWNTKADLDSIYEKYFTARYKKFAPDMKKAYSLIEDSNEYCSSLRAHGRRSALFHLIEWNGRHPVSPLPVDDHLDKNAFEISQNAVDKLNSAYKIVLSVYKTAIAETEVPERIEAAVNPLEALKYYTVDRLVTNLEEDLSSINYGLSLSRLISLFINYHDTYFRGESTHEIWSEIDALATDMAQHDVPLDYINSLTEIEVYSRNALVRSQLDRLYYRCSAERKEH